MSIQHHPDSSDYAGQRGKVRREVVCKICQAVYVPARTHRRLANSSQAVVESAFMGMCHFCFRCRRPACPSCWDDVHDVCGACSLDARLPFRSDVPPLDGVIFPPLHHVPVARVRTVTPPLVCVRPGRFQEAPLPIESQTTLYMQTLSDQLVSDVSKKDLVSKIALPSSEPQSPVAENGLDMVYGKISEVPPLPPLGVPVSKSPDIEGSATWLGKREAKGGRRDPQIKLEDQVDMADMVTRPGRREAEGGRRGPQVKPEDQVDVADVATRPGKRGIDGGSNGPEGTLRPGLIVRDVVLLIILLILILILSAISFPSLNDGIVQIIHVDIRAEIAYLLQLIQHLF